MEARMESARTAGFGGVLHQLTALARERGMEDLEGRLHLAQSLVQDDLAATAEVIFGLPAQDIVQRSAVHLLSGGGKRLRPLCVALSARLGPSVDVSAVRNLAAAVELVHNATLLHDDVVDHGETRRGAPTARALFGNAASVFAGDWLLIEAMRQVRASDRRDLLDRLLSTIDEMIVAEALQLAAAGRLRIDRDTYFRVVRGKTASLFRWGCFAGGRAGGLDDRSCETLSAYGEHLGMAFQLVDDLLDFEGNEALTGKALFADLRDGKSTYPLTIMLEREPAARELLLPFVDTDPSATAAATQQVLTALNRTGALDATRELARHHAESAVALLEPFPDSPARDALRAVALATVHRDH
jgi:octaprenyl-diphosphate synthase